MSNRPRISRAPADIGLLAAHSMAGADAVVQVVRPGFDALRRPLVRRYRASGDAALLAALTHHGEVLARQWLERPTRRGGRARYTERQLFLGSGARAHAEEARQLSEGEAPASKSGLVVSDIARPSPLHLLLAIVDSDT
jgi:hypothetical protein